MQTLRLLPSQASQYRELMLEAYKLHPTAFTSSHYERALLPLSWWEKRLAVSEPADEIVLGFWAEDVLAGVVGVQFEIREKIRHKATLFGMYVRSQFQNRGYGRSLVSAAIATASQRSGVTQMQLTVTEGNTGAIDLYKSTGFHQFGVEPKAVFVNGAYWAKIHMSRGIGGSEIVG
jgi:ribosomal protein S18 acetylase RimI-like enzyme